VEKDLPKEEEEAGVTLIKLMGVAVAAVAAAVAIDRPQVEFGMMEMTFVSLIHQGAHPGHYTLNIQIWKQSQFLSVWDYRWLRGRKRPSNSAHINCSHLNPDCSSLCNLFKRTDGKSQL
jgi:hypothetical protein